MTLLNFTYAFTNIGVIISIEFFKCLQENIYISHQTFILESTLVNPALQEKNVLSAG